MLGRSKLDPLDSMRLKEIEAKVDAVAVQNNKLQEQLQTVRTQNNTIAKVLTNILRAIKGEGETHLVDHDIKSPHIPYK